MFEVGAVEVVVMVMVAVGAEEGEGAAVMTVESLEGTWA